MKWKDLKLKEKMYFVLFVLFVVLLIVGINLFDKIRICV